MLPRWLPTRRTAGLLLLATVVLVVLGLDRAVPGRVSAQTPADAAPTTGAGKDRPAWEPGESCVTSSCHEDLRGEKHHGPVALRVCEPCHDSVDGTHSFQPRFEGAALCRHCHESFFKLEGTRHGPVASGLCTSCHDPHGGTGESYLLRAKVTDGLCFSCHERESILGKAKAHGPLQLGGDCSLCHDPHASDHPGLLRRSGVELCSACHEEIAHLEQPGHRWHEPAEENCGVCHEPHSSDLPQHLKARLPGLCLDCHEEQKNELAGERIHEALLNPERCVDCHEEGPPAEEIDACPLVGAAGEPGRCLDCHDPHASEHHHLLEASLMDSCLRCHDVPIQVPGRPDIPSIKAQIEGKKHVHGPLAQGNCSACHEPHASDHWRLLIDEFPAAFYAGYEKGRYDLCFHCHDDALVLEDETRFATGFRDGSKNLHALHVKRDQKGRSCRACHEMHASDLPFQMRESVPFGQWQMPIGFETLDDGGACTPGCHTRTEYHRDKE